MSLRGGVWLFSHAFLLQLAAYMVRPTAAYQAIELGADPAAVGLVAASFAILPLVLAVAIGRWIDNGQARAALPIGAVLMVLGGVGLLWFSPTLWALLAWNVAIGLGHLLSVLGEQNVVARAASDRMDSAFGRYTFVASAGQAVAPMLMAGIGGSAIMPDTGLLVTAYLATCVVMLATSFPLGVMQLAPSGSAARPGSLREALRLEKPAARTMFGGMMTSMFVLAAIDLVQVYLPALGVERGIPTWIIGALLAARAIATMLSRLQLGWLVAHVGRGRLVAISTAIGAVAVGLLVVEMSPWLMGVLLVIAGVTLGIGQPLSMSVITLAAPPGTVATWLALRLSGNRLGQSVIPAALSILALGMGSAGVFLVTGIMLAATAGVAGVTLREDRS